MRIIKDLGWIICVIVGLEMIIWGMFPEKYIQVLTNYSSDIGARRFSIGIGAIILLFAWWILILRLRKDRKRESISLKEPDGEIIINLSSVRDCIRKEVETESLVRSANIDFLKGSDIKELKIKADLVIEESNDFPSHINKIKELIKKKFFELMDIDTKLNIIINIRKIIPAAGNYKKKNVSENVSSEVNTGFQGELEYPIEKTQDNEEDK